MNDRDLIVALPVAGEAPAGAPFVIALGDGCSEQCSELNVSDGWRGEHRTGYYSAMGIDPTRCARTARYRISGAPLCSQHAGGLLLNLALEMSFRQDFRA